MTLFNELQQLMVDHRFRPNKKMAQHFVVDELFLQRMVEEANLKKKDVVLEIGSGTGFLSQEILKHCKVVGVELSIDLGDVLEKKFLGQKNFTLIRGNFLSQKLPKFNKVVSLPPYHISGEIMNRLFREKFDVAVLGFQREFCEKLFAQPGFKEYSYLTVLTDHIFHRILLIKNVPPKTFHPKPESYSSLIKLVRKKNVDESIDFTKFAIFTKQLFRYKNKNTANALDNCLRETKDHFNIKREEAQKIVEHLELGEVKVNLLETDEVVELFRKISAG